MTEDKTMTDVHALAQAQDLEGLTEYVVGLYRRETTKAEGFYVYDGHAWHDDYTFGTRTPFYSFQKAAMVRGAMLNSFSAETSLKPGALVQRFNRTTGQNLLHVVMATDATGKRGYSMALGYNGGTGKNGEQPARGPTYSFV